MTAGKLQVRSTVSVERQLATRTFVLVVALSVFSALALTFAAAQRFKQILMPEVMLETRAVGESVQATINQAVSIGIPFESLVGVEDFLGDTLKENPEIAFLKVSKAGQVSYRQGTSDQSKEEIVVQDIAENGSAPAVTIGVRAGYLNEKLHVLFGDAAVVLFVAVIAGLEISLFFAYRWLIRPFDTWRVMIAGVRSGRIQRSLTRRVSGPLAELLNISNDKIARLRIALGLPAPATTDDWVRPAAYDARIALFLFVLSEELLRSFFPLYVREFVDSSSQFGAQFAISAPLIAYMFFAGAGTLYSIGFIERIGVRRTFQISVLAATVSLCGLAAASSLLEVVLWRSLTAVSYALATIACQVYIARCSAQENDQRGIGIFVSAIAAACVCGAPIGALLADMFGQQVTLLVAAGAALLAWMMFRNVAMPSAPDNVGTGADKTQEKTQETGGHFLQLLRNARIVALMLCSVVPSKMLLAGMLFFITPLLLQEYGLSQATIGQFFVLFYGLLLTGNMFSSRLLGRANSQKALIVIGGFVGCLGALSLWWFNAPWAMALAIICFGLGTSLTQSPLTAETLRIVQTELPHIPPSNAIALSRVFERLGGIIGALLGALLSALLGYGHATAALGAIALLLACGNLWLLRSPTRLEA